MTVLSNADAGVMVKLGSKPPHVGKLQVQVASAVAPGRATIVTIENAAKMNENERRFAVGRAAAGAAMRLNVLYGDDLDASETIRKADEALYKLMKTARPVAAVGLFTTFEPLKTDGPAKKTSEVARRASEDDPLTKAVLRGKDIADLA